MNFTITCSLNDSELYCKVDDGFAPVLPHHTTCQVHDKRPSKCEESQTHSQFTAMAIVMNYVIV